MELFAYQNEIAEAVEHHRITSVQAPRQNGKTEAAIEAAFRMGGRVAFLSHGSAVTRNTFLRASEHPKVLKSRRSNGSESIEHANGSIIFLAYTNSGSRGLILDGIVFDDADRVGVDIFASYYPSLFASHGGGRILSVGTLREGLAGHLDAVADQRFHWRGLTEEEANPGLGALIKPESLEMAKKILPQDIYDREHLGLTAADRQRLEKRHVSALIHCQLYGSHPKAA